MIVTVDEVKTHLRIQHDEEDDYIAGLIAQAQTAAEDYCRVSFEPEPDEEGNVTEVPQPVRLAVILMTSFYYENRDIPDMTTYKATRMAFDSLLYPYSANTSVLPGSFVNGSVYSFLLVVSDGIETASAMCVVDRAFANLHLAGLSTGGVAIGKFSAATQGKPLFECAFPIVLSGSKTYGPESSMPSNPVEGQLYFVVD